jgi:glycosyltransferase involved in cell wall biosynthesis
MFGLASQRLEWVPANATISEVCMSDQPGVDVIVPVSRDPANVGSCVRRLLEHADSRLGRVLLIEEPGTDRSTRAALDAAIKLDLRIHVLQSSVGPGEVHACNIGLSAGRGDVVLLRNDVAVSPGWLTELAEVVHSEQRTAGSSPLINEAGACGIGIEYNAAIEVVEPAIRAACAFLPRSTVVPSLTESCIYLRRDVVDSAGPLDGRFTALRPAIIDWLARAGSLGFEARRANHAYVHRCNTGVDIPRSPLPPHVKHQIDRFDRSLESRLASHAARVTRSGRLRVALDIRHVPPEEVGTRTYAVSLAKALAEMPEIELTLLVRNPAQARGLNGRVVTEVQWADDVEVIHKPAQVLDPRELRLLFESSAHLVISYLDLIGYRIPVSFPTNGRYDHYRATSSLTLPATQRIIAISHSARDEVAAEFGINHDEIAVVHLGVEPAVFSQVGDDDNEIARKLALDTPYFFSIATDFPHKNLANLVAAYAALRDRWHDDHPPLLVLAGHTSSSRTGFYPVLESRAMPDGVAFLGPVSRDQLRVLYQRALALVFPSLYEGFGLTPLEAMAAGTPVIAMPISAVPEVCGDAVLYSQDLSIAALSAAMESIATNPHLRDELAARGKTHVDAFSWAQTARATVEAYRSAVFRPSPRALQARRMLRDAIIRWSEPRSVEAATGSPDDSELYLLSQPVGIRNAFKVLNVSLRARLRRELRRFQSGSRRPASRRNRRRV